MNNLIVLIGYMGSGKSSVAKALSSKLKTNHIDLDKFIESLQANSVQSKGGSPRQGLSRRHSRSGATDTDRQG